MEFCYTVFEENWIDQLNTVLIEIAGLNEIFSFDGKYLILLSKLEGLKLIDTDFKLYQNCFDTKFIGKTIPGFTNLRMYEPSLTSLI